MNGDLFSAGWQVEPRTGYRLRRFEQEGRAFDVALAFPDAPEPPGGFPLLVLTDGALHFEAVAAASAALLRRPEKTRVGPLAIAGIASGRGWTHDGEARKHDLVPGQGAEALLALIRAQMIPAIEEQRPIARGEGAIIGHSLGGLFALNALAIAPDLFRTCVAVSPSLWRLPELSRQVATEVGGRGARIMLASGEHEPRINADLPAAAETLGGAAQVQRLMLADEDHGSILFAALPAMLRFVHA